MQKNETLTEVVRKLRRNKATILSDEEVDLLARAMRARIWLPGEEDWIPPQFS